MGWLPWDEGGPAKTPFSPGYILGKGFGADKAVALVGCRSGYKVATLYDPKGNKKNGIWATTTSDGLFCIQFQWDNAMDLDCFVSDTPTYASMLAYTDNQQYSRFKVPVGLVLNLPAVVKGQNMETKPQGGTFGNYAVDKGVDWLMNTPQAKAMLKAKLPVKTADAFVAFSIMDVSREDMAIPRP